MRKALFEELVREAVADIPEDFRQIIFYIKIDIIDFFSIFFINLE